MRSTPWMAGECSYDHLKPGGVITFSRWSSGAETNRLFAVAKAMLLSEGVSHPESHLAAITSGNIVTLLASSLPFSEPDLRRLHEIMNEMEFKPLYLPGEGTTVPELRNILATKNLTETGRAPRIGRLGLLAGIRFVSLLLQRRAPLGAARHDPLAAGCRQPACHDVSLRLHAGGHHPGDYHHRSARSTLDSKARCRQGASQQEVLRTSSPLDSVSCSWRWR